MEREGGESMIKNLPAKEILRSIDSILASLETNRCTPSSAAFVGRRKKRRNERSACRNGVGE